MEAVPGKSCKAPTVVFPKSDFSRHDRARSRANAELIMKVSSSDIPGILILEPHLFNDHRGFVFEFFQSQNYREHGIGQTPFVQDNLCHSASNVIRGLHLQNPSLQGKLVSVLRGRVLDVAVDVRAGSPHFGRYVATELSEENRLQVWVPRGFAHGFAVLSESADVFYKSDNRYSPDDEITIRWNDPAIAIPWNIKDPSLNERDANAPLLSEIRNLPIYGQQ
jgi:dTDP-4-dehydrorhamnose 3,5-epimerase